MGMRKNFVGGNWKCNLMKNQVTSLVKQLNGCTVNAARTDVVVAPVFTQLEYVKSQLNNGIQVSAQNVSLTGTGAFTGEISCHHLKDLGLEWAIIGHSERRALFGEGNEVVGQKTKNAIENGLQTITCVGETLADREGGATMEVVSAQLDAVNATLSKSDWANVVLAYEPVWAIGTGKVATPEIAQEVHAHIRSWLAERVGADVAEQTRVIYGGSVTDTNCNDLISETDIDGFLVGGASLKIAFNTIIESCNK